MYLVEADTLLIVSSAPYLFNKDMSCAPRNVCYTSETQSFHFYTILNRHCVSLAVMGNNLRHTGNVHNTKSRRYCYKKKKIHIKLGNSITENKYALVYFCQIYLYPLAINFQ